MGYLHRFGFHVWNLIVQDGNREIAVCRRSVFVSRPQQVLKSSAEWMRSRLVRRKRRSVSLCLLITADTQSCSFFSGFWSAEVTAESLWDICIGFGFHAWNSILQDGNGEIAFCRRSVFVSRPPQQVLKGSAEWMRSRLVRRKRRSAAGEGGTVPLPPFLAENCKGLTHAG